MGCSEAGWTLNAFYRTSVFLPPVRTVNVKSLTDETAGANSCGPNQWYGLELRTGTRDLQQLHSTATRL